MHPSLFLPFCCGVRRIARTTHSASQPDSQRSGIGPPTIVVRPRTGRWSQDANGGWQDNKVDKHSVVYATIGVFLLSFGWFGFNSGSTTELSNGQYLKAHYGTSDHMHRRERNDRFQPVISHRPPRAQHRLVLVQEQRQAAEDQFSRPRTSPRCVRRENTEQKAELLLQKAELLLQRQQQHDFVV